jgi:surface antigen
MMAATVPGVLALSMAGCSFSYQLGSLFEKKDDQAEYTGSIPSSSEKATANLPPEGDLAFARAAATEVLNRGGKDTSQAWENPRTGARGTVTPLAAAYDQDGFVCRDFLASYVRGKEEGWLQGAACRVHQGKWEVRSLRPRQQS